MRRAFALRKSERIITALPLLFIIIAAFLLIYAVQAPPQHASIAYTGWLLAVGVLGSLAFIGMNVLSVQSDVTFDLVNERLIWLRIALGGLFALILALPFGFNDFIAFVDAIAKTVQARGKGEQETRFALERHAFLLLLPFLLGFSTTLVITFLNKIIEGVEVIFGKRTSTETHKAKTAGEKTVDKSLSPAFNKTPKK